MTNKEAHKILSQIVFESDNESLALMEALEALEKQIPKKAITNEVFALAFDYDCPRCGARIITKIDGKWTAGNKSRYCYACGQALDWSEE